MTLYVWVFPWVTVLGPETVNASPLADEGDGADEGFLYEYSP
jgi:hypothetical protein